MRMIAVNKFFYRRGGCETYYFNLNTLLQNKGHTLIHFSMKDDKNCETPYDDYFIDNIDYEKMSFSKKLKSSAKIMYSIEAKKNIESLIKETFPDIAHLHNFYHQMSPSILFGIKRFNIPIINTVHDFKLICPNYRMFNEKGICEDCMDGSFYKCFRNKCVKGSRAASMVNTFEAYVHRLLKSYELVDAFISPSLFLKNKLIKSGISEDKVIHIPNFINIDEYKPMFTNCDYFVYMGRLCTEKGLETLVRAMKYVRKGKLLIIGTGPYEEELKSIVEKENLNNIVFTGYKTGDELGGLIKKALFTVLPSMIYENCPMSLLESMAYGKAVLASDIGGIPEMIDEGDTGLTFKPGDVEDLAAKINYMLYNEKITVSMGRKARNKVENEYNQDIHYERLKGVYDKVLKL